MLDRRHTLLTKRPEAAEVIARARVALGRERPHTRALRNERTAVRGGDAVPGTPEHERGRSIARFLYWSTVAGGFLVSGVPGVLLFVGGIPLSKMVERADAEADSVAEDGSTDRHESLARVSGYAQIAQYVASVL